MKNFILFSIFCCAFAASAQNFFQKRFGNISPFGFYPHSIFQTADGGYMVAGVKGIPQGSYFSSLIRFDSLGNELWNKIYQSSTTSIGSRYAAKTSDGGYVLVGSLSNQKHIVVNRTDGNGDTLWIKEYSAPNMYGAWISQTDDHGYLIAGFLSQNGISLGIPLIKTDSSGNVQWVKRFNLISVTDLVQTDDGGLLMTGNYNTGSSFIPYLLKIDSTGNILWYKMYETHSSVGIYVMLHQTAGGYTLLCTSDSLGAGLNDILILRTDTAGNLLWSKAYGTTGRDYASSFVPTFDGGYVISGSTLGQNFLSDVYILNINSMGNLLWNKSIGDPMFKESVISGNDILQTPDSGFIIASEADSGGAWPNFYSNIYLIKTDASGFSGCNEGNPATVVTPLSLQTYTDTVSADTFSVSVNNFVVTIGSLGTGITLCESIGIEERESLNGLDIYPNPTSGKFKFEFPDSGQRVDLKIYDAMGELIFDRDESGNHEMQIDLTKYSSGIYFVQAKSGEKIFRGKIIKE